jgi:hypothetical protein
MRKLGPCSMLLKMKNVKGPTSSYAFRGTLHGRPEHRRWRPIR